MRILMVAPQPFFRPRGTPFSVLHRVRALVRLGHSVDLVTYPFGESPDLPGLTIHRAARPPLVRDVPIGPSPAKLLLDFPLVVEAWRLARTGAYDLLHTHEEAGWLCAWIARRYGLPHLYDMHSSLPQQFSNFGRFNWRPVVAAFRGLERHALRNADGVIAICPELRDHALASGYAGALEMIENTLNFQVPDPSQEEIESLRTRLGLAGRAVILYTGTLEPYQGLDLLLRAAADVVRRAPRARFLIVGGTAAQVAELRRQALEAGAGPHVVFVEAVPPDQVFHYHRLADVLVTTRVRGTNTPLKVYQYLRAGRPIVATRIASHTQVLDEGAAELVDPSPAAIADGLVRVLSDPGRAADLGRAAQRLSRERYAEHIYLDRLESLLSRLCGAPAPRTHAA
jgi:glycosyltransferase involved in cell wall biosynthesis